MYGNTSGSNKENAVILICALVTRGELWSLGSPVSYPSLAGVRRLLGISITFSPQAYLSGVLNQPENAPQVHVY